MPVAFQIVVSSENTRYMAWQTQIFCFSALTRLHRLPIVVVHATDLPLRQEYRDLRARGFPILEAPSYATHPSGSVCPTRNTIGSLLAVASEDVASEDQDEYLLLCEPDMIFASALDYPDGFAAEFYGYMDYCNEFVKGVIEKRGLAADVDILNQQYRIGVPYLIPGSEAARVGARWLEILDEFEKPKWIESMYAYGIALKLEGIPSGTTHVVIDNFRPLDPLIKPLIHYCYGDARWNKRTFFQAGTPFDREWSVAGVSPECILHELFSQVNEARHFFGDASQDVHSILPRENAGSTREPREAARKTIDLADQVASSNRVRVEKALRAPHTDG